jgi:hypothetical protein
MQIESPEDFAATITQIEAELDVRYPPTAPALFSELAAMICTGQPHGLFKEAHLLTTPAAVVAMRDELGGPLSDGCLLPFLSDGDGDYRDVYGFDPSDPGLHRIAVYSVHTIVNTWSSTAAFLTWAREFAPSYRPPLEKPA